jgi:hypothetical protein
MSWLEHNWGWLVLAFWLVVGFGVPLVYWLIKKITGKDLRRDPNEAMEASFKRMVRLLGSQKRPKAGFWFQ